MSHSRGYYVVRSVVRAVFGLCVVAGFLMLAGLFG